jgi:hypothetical protein
MIAAIYDLLYLLPMCIVAMIAASQYMPFPAQPILPYILMAVVFTVALCLAHWKNRLKFFLPVIVIISAGVPVLLQPADDRVAFMFANIWVAWVTVVVSLSFIIGRLILSNKWTKRVFAVLIIAALFVIMWMHMEIPKIAVALSFFPALLILAEEIQRAWKKSGYTDPVKHLVCISPFIALTTILVFVAPAPDEPYSWDMVVKLWQKASEGIELSFRFLHSEDEDFCAQAGFSENTVMTGEVNDDVNEIMEMRTPKGVNGVVYLTGSVSDTFNGRGWETVHTPDAAERMFDVLETRAAAEAKDSKHFTYYVKKTDIGLKYLRFNTRHVFAPLKTVFSGYETGDVSFEDKDGGLISYKSLGYNTEYELSFYRLNRGNEVFDELANEPVSFDEETWDKVRRTVVPDSGIFKGDKAEVDTSFAAYKEYKKTISENYLPETEVSEKTRAFLDELMEGAETDYEKLLRIEYVLGDMEYNKNPGALPQDVDTASEFLDYFLFNSQTGYCVHYATAFVLLARAEGIPARYAQGYYVKHYDTELTIVKNSMSHAWAEAYIDGVGWISFEPTPGKRHLDKWRSSGGSNAEDTGSEGHKEALMEEAKPEIEEEPVPLEENISIDPKQVLMVVIPFVTLIVLLVLFIALARVIAALRYRRMKDTEKFRVMCRKNLTILSMIGFERGAYETLEELKGKVGESVPPEHMGFIKGYEKLLYAEKEPRTDELRGAELAYRYLLGLLKEKKGKRYIFYRLRL